MFKSIKTSKVTQAAITCTDLLRSLFNEEIFCGDSAVQTMVRSQLEAYDNAEDDPNELNEDDYIAKRNRVDQRIRLIIHESFGVEASGSTIDEALDCLEDQCQQAKIRLRKAGTS
jgi:hypothetical protein